MSVGGVVTRAAESVAIGGGKQLRVGFIGIGERGTGLLKVLLNFPGVEIPALCDIERKNLKDARSLVEKSVGKSPESYDKDACDYRRLLARDDIDAVVIATPQELHAEMAIDSMKAGKAVGSEVPACCTVEECRQLVRTARQYNGRYMLLENCLYSQPVMMVQNMVDSGVFGEITFGGGAEIRQSRDLRFKSERRRTDVRPERALGPLCRWMGINKQDSLATVVAHPYANEEFATDQVLIRTTRGRTIEVRYDPFWARPSEMGQYSLRGTKASFESAFGQRKLFIEDKSRPHQWEDFEKYTDQYQQPCWNQRISQAGNTGHGGGDYLVISDFLGFVRTGQSRIDVVDAATWSVIRPLSEQSIRSGNKPLEVPDLTLI
jgi:predicted dehydrogenase